MQYLDPLSYIIIFTVCSTDVSSKHIEIKHIIISLNYFGFDPYRSAILEKSNPPQQKKRATLTIYLPIYCKTKICPEIPFELVVFFDSIFEKTLKDPY